MVYLYGALGIAMLSGIMAIFEMGLSLTGKSPLPMPKNNYLKSSEKIKEKDLFLFSNSNHPSYDDVKINSGLVGVNICNELIAHQSILSVVGSPTKIFLPNTLNASWNNGCVMDYGSHQVLLLPSSKEGDDPYLIASCTEYDKNLRFCPFVEKSEED